MNRKQAAFTLLEMMASVAVLAIVTLYLTDMLIRQSRTYTVVDQVTESQQNLRVIGDLIDRELRVAGFMVTESAAVCGVDRTNNPDVFVVSDADPINPANQTQADLAVSVSSASYSGNGVNTLSLSGNSTLDNLPFYDIDGDGVADSDFLDVPATGMVGGVIVVDRNNPTRGTSCGQILSGSLTPGGLTSTVRVDFGFNGTVAGTPLAAWTVAMNPEDLVAVPAHVYTVNAANQLVRDGLVLADDVEDLQIAFFFDLDGDDVVDGAAGANPPFVSDLEYPGSNPGGVTYVSSNWDHTTLREARVSLVLRTRAQDPDVLRNPGTAQSQFIALENRVAPVGPPDGFRRRSHVVTVRPRNLGFRPPA